MIVLDTHAWVWWLADPAKLTTRARRAIDRAARGGDGVVVSSISVWEVAMLVARGRLALTVDVAEWLQRAEAVPGVRFVPVDNAIALRAVRLPGFPHPDPADRMIVSTALGGGASLVTADRRLRAYKPLKTLWD